MPSRVLAELLSLLPVSKPCFLSVSDDLYSMFSLIYRYTFLDLCPLTLQSSHNDPLRQMQRTNKSGTYTSGTQPSNRLYPESPQTVYTRSNCIPRSSRGNHCHIRISLSHVLLSYCHSFHVFCPRLPSSLHANTHRNRAIHVSNLNDTDCFYSGHTPSVLLSSPLKI